jgi:hypothetical protein
MHVAVNLLILNEDMLRSSLEAFSVHPNAEDELPHWSRGPFFGHSTPVIDFAELTCVRNRIRGHWIETPEKSEIGKNRFT